MKKWSNSMTTNTRLVSFNTNEKIVLLNIAGYGGQ